MKKFVSILFICTLILSLCVTASFASENEPGISPHFEDCEVCPNGRVTYTHSTYGAWRTQYYVDCPHGDSRVKDKYQERTETRIYECNSCDYSYEEHHTQSRIVCMSKG